MVHLRFEGFDLLFQVDFMERLEEGDIVLGGWLAKDGLGADKAIEAVYHRGLGRAQPGEVRNGGGHCDQIHDATENDTLHFDLGFQIGRFCAALGVLSLGGAQLIGVDAVFEGVEVAFLAAALAFGGHEDLLIVDTDYSDATDFFIRHELTLVFTNDWTRITRMARIFWREDHGLFCHN
jgi:hypothetical protein